MSTRSLYNDRDTEKQKYSNRIETQIEIETRHIRVQQKKHKQKKKNNIEIIKRIMSEKKTSLPSLSNLNWKTVNDETEWINQ